MEKKQVVLVLVFGTFLGTTNISRCVPCIWYYWQKNVVYNLSSYGKYFFVFANYTGFASALFSGIHIPWIFFLFQELTVRHNSWMLVLVACKSTISEIDFNELCFLLLLLLLLLQPAHTNRSCFYRCDLIFIFFCLKESRQVRYVQEIIPLDKWTTHLSFLAPKK